jgi:prevent-host-death family protein
MGPEISQRELRNHSGEVMRRLDAGESFVVTRNGTPIAELRPLRRQRFVKAETAAAMFRGLPPIDYEQFRKDLDTVVDPSIEPRS